MNCVLCLNCGRISFEGMFCTYCHSPLLGANPKMEFNDRVYLGDIEGEGSPFLLPINSYFGYHFAFYGVTGTGKTRAAMNLTIKAENSGLCLRILDVEGEWKRIIPKLSKPPMSKIENVFIADEAQLLVPKIIHKAVATDTWVTIDFATRLRKRGESLVITTQSPSNIEDDIHRNAQNIFVFRLQDPRDVETI